MRCSGQAARLGALRAHFIEAPLAAERSVRRTLKVVALAGLAALSVTLGCSRPPQSDGFPPGVPATQLASAPPGSPVLVSLVALLSRPEDFDGKAVQVVGYGHLEFEGNALYLHQEDCERGLVTNSIRLALPGDGPFLPFNDRYVIVAGVFRATPGEAAIRPGTLTEIFRYDPLPTREQRRETSGRPK
jgi:hypothetical protein